MEKLNELPDPENKFIRISTIDHIKAFDLLQRKRVDVVIAYEFDRARSEPAKIPNRHHFNNDFIIDTTNEVVACWVSNDTREFIDTLNTAIADWRADDKLGALFGRTKD